MTNNRINKYIGMIMESTAESWRRLKKREMIRKDADLKGNLSIYHDYTSHFYKYCHFQDFFY